MEVPLDPPLTSGFHFIHPNVIGVWGKAPHQPQIPFGAEVIGGLRGLRPRIEVYCGVARGGSPCWALAEQEPY